MALKHHVNSLLKILNSMVLLLGLLIYPIYSIIPKQVVFNSNNITYTINQISDDKILRQNKEDCGFHTLWNLKNAYNKENPQQIHSPNNDLTQYESFRESLKQDLSGKKITIFTKSNDYDMDTNSKIYFLGKYEHI